MVKSRFSSLFLRINQVNVTSYRIFKAPNRASDCCGWEVWSKTARDGTEERHDSCISQKGRFFSTWLFTPKSKASLKNYNNSLLSQTVRYTVILYLGHTHASWSMSIFQGNIQLNIWLRSEDVWSIFSSEAGFLVHWRQK